MSNGPEDILDALIESAINAGRYASGLVGQIVKILKQLEKELVEAIGASIARAKKERRELRAMLKETRKTIQDAYAEVIKEAGKSLAVFGKLEIKNTQAAINVALGIDAKKLGIPEVTAKALAEKVQVLGTPAEKYWHKQAEATRKRFEAVVQKGIIEARTTAEIAREVRGTPEAPGIIEASKREAEALARTAVQSVANEARQKTYEANADLITGYMHLSTLDNRTTPICMARSGAEWDAQLRPIPPNDKPYEVPPLHFNCRSVIIPVLKSFAELAGEDAPSTGEKEATQERLFREKLTAKLRKQGLTERQIANELAGKRAAMNGQAPRNVTFDQWLRGKSEKFQNDLLGPKRAALWRAGKITLADLTNQRDRPLTLKELEELIEKRASRKK